MQLALAFPRAIPQSGLLQEAKLFSLFCIRFYAASLVNSLILWTRPAPITTALGHLPSPSTLSDERKPISRDCETRESYYSGHYCFHLPIVPLVCFSTIPFLPITDPDLCPESTFVHSTVVYPKPLSLGLFTLDQRLRVSALPGTLLPLLIPYIFRGQPHSSS
jgi:hypothetical protein